MEPISTTVTCESDGCINSGVNVAVDKWVGSMISCGPCGAVLAEQAEWYEPPTLEDLGLPTGPEQAAGLIANMTEQERQELAALINPPPAEPSPGPTTKQGVRKP